MVHKIQQSGGSAFTIGADLNTLNGIRDLYAALEETLRKRTGDNRFDILVNNAGIGQILTVEEATEESFDEVMDIDVKAPFFVTQQALPRLKDEGRIINISSFVTRVASPAFSPTAYRRVQSTHLRTSWLSNLGAVILR